MSEKEFRQVDELTEYPATALACAIDTQNITYARAALEQLFLQNRLPVLEWPNLKKLLISNNRPLLRLIVPWLEPMKAMDIALLEPKDYARYITQLRNAGMKIERLVREEAQLLTARTGDRMPDGSIYLGLHKGKDWFVAENSLRISFNEAVSHVEKMRDHGHDDWEIPDGLVVPIMERNKDAGAFACTYHISKDFGHYEGYWARETDGYPHGEPDRREIYVFGQKNIAWGGCLVLTREKSAAAILRPVRSEPRLRRKP